MHGLPARIGAAWRSLPSDQRLAALAALGLFVTMFLPWYQLTAARGKAGGLDSRSVSAFQDFSWIEAAVLLVAVGVLFLLFARAERRAFHLPGGDGTIIFAAGVWATALLVWRAFDKPSAGDFAAVGLDWGFLFAFAASGTLAYAGWRVRAAHRPEPPNPAADPPPVDTTPLTPPPAPDDAAPTEPLRRARPPLSTEREPGTEPEPEQLPLTAAHGSEEPLPREEL